MVFFNCNACGEALKKNQVEKHTMKCRFCEVLSCVDCGKDFWGNDYQAHTKCISEEEKYCGKGYVPKVNKGEVKQEQWIEKVQNAIENSMSNPKMKGLLERLKDYPNIPRKKTKFENFLKNSLRINSDQLISQVWDTLMASAGQGSGTQNGHDKTVNESVSNKLPGNIVQENYDTEEKEQRNKKINNEKNKHGDIYNKEERKEESRKRKFSEEEKTIQGKITEKYATTEMQEKNDLHEESSIDGQKLSKRERKEERRKKANKKEKKDKNENNCNNEEKKRKKRKLAEIEEAEVVGENLENSQKRKSESLEDNDTLEESRPLCDGEDDEETLEPKKKKIKKAKFNWEATILTVLKSKGEISLKKLQKKVISEFAAQDAANYSEDNLKTKFQKKVNKMAQVKVFKDRVKLK